MPSGSSNRPARRERRPAVGAAHGRLAALHGGESPGPFRTLAACGVLVPLVLLGVFGWWSWRAVETEARGRVERVSATVEEQARRIIENQVAVLEAALARARGIDFDDFGRDRRVHDFLARLERNTPATPSLILVRPDTARIVAWSGGHPPPAVDQTPRDYFRAHRDGDAGTYIGETFRTAASGQTGFTVSRRDEESGLLAVALVPPEQFRGFYASFDEGRRDSIDLVRSDGTMLARHPMPAGRADLIGLRLPPDAVGLRFARGELQAPTVQRAALDGIDRLYHARRVGSYPLLVAYGLDRARLDALWLRQVAPFAALSLVGSALLWSLVRRHDRAADARRRAESAASAAEARADQAETLAESEERLRMATAAAGIGMFEIDWARRERRWSPELRSMLRIPDGLDITRDEALVERIIPDDAERARFRERLAASFDPAGDGTYEDEHTVRRYDGTPAAMLMRGRTFLEKSPAGLRPLRTIGLMMDVTQRREAMERARQGEAQLRAALRAGRTFAFVWDPLTGLVERIDEAGVLDRRPLAEPAADYFSCIHEADREAFVALVSGLAPEQPTYATRYRYRRRDTGVEIWLEESGSAEFDGAGRFVRLRGIAADITERKRREEQVDLLMREVNHRAKNMLSVIQVVARQTARSSPEGFVERFEERIMGLAASQDLLVQNEWRGVDLDELVRSQLAHVEDLVGSRVRLSGPPIRVSASAAQNIGMPLHELATNAGKYGALSLPGGTVDIAWRLHRSDAAGEAGFEMTWTERDGPPVRPPKRRGFGTTVIVEMARMGLDADVTLDLLPQGAVWRLACRAATVLEPGAAVAPEEAETARRRRGRCQSRNEETGP